MLIQEAGEDERRPFKFGLGSLFRSCSGQPESMSYLLVGEGFIDVCGGSGKLANQHLLIEPSELVLRIKSSNN